MATFKVPYVPANPTSWGPPSETAAGEADGESTLGAPASRFASLPYAPFGRSDRIGRCADFTTQSFARTGDATAGYFRNARHGRNRDEANKNLEFQYKVDAEEAKEFQLVDSSKLGGPGQSGGPGGGGGKRFVPQARRRANAQRLRQLNARRDDANRQGGNVGRYNQPQRTRAGGRFGGGRGGPGGRGGRGGWGRGGRGMWRDRIDRQASVSVRPDWRRVEEVDLSKLSKGTSPLSNLVDTSPPKGVEDLLWCGFLDQYNDQYDKVSTRTVAPLKRVETKEFYPVTTTDDPVIEKLAIEGKGTVFATDAILAHLMTCPRSVYPWDIVVQKLPTGALFFDKRDASQFDYLTVHETSNTPPTPVRDNSNEEELMNSPERLSLEATMINQNFTQQILRSSKYRTNFDHPNPFWDEDDNDGMEPASVAYRYRKFDLGEGVQIVARTELHGLGKDRQKADTSKIVTNISANKKKKKKKGDVNPLEVPDGDQYMTAYALNEYDPSQVANAPPARPGASINWREKIDNQAGAVLASELKNNSFKLAKWTAQSLLAGASQMKIGFVSRTSPKNAYEHVVLATQTYRPMDFAAQITLNQGTMWGHMRLFIKLLENEPEGKYVIMRDPNRAIVRIYGVPPGTFEDDSDGSDEEDGDEDSNEEDGGEGEAEE
eukprot:CAMPEP_0172529806 /NCGR_PEP_ID=MMETSP1067-20121228/3784_1 /TAXON_ID=265564 ORGANISM="Thalassiosira punctigera, Strain Tpunct2005C2" /NCGR_SAMPLE_ID=MMETSP1067 /ASSEMBLY_ACC=CAM_ASM_000444 /LENGTH=660 /DNA_ID=CAMNT_0013313931 /DNA_START=45 /DNA_END=2027 /DNA_ORIENTATION=-